MANKPKYVSEYESDQAELVRAPCLYVATKLGDIRDELVVVGGFVPSRLIDQAALAEDVDPAGTTGLVAPCSLFVRGEGPAPGFGRRTPTPDGNCC